MTTPRERQKGGKALRQQVPRSSHGAWAPGPDRPDPIGLLQAQDVSRLEYLLPIRYGRMAESPFAFLRGSAAVMAADLAPTPMTGLQVQICGDAHLANFGAFATPGRNLYSTSTISTKLTPVPGSGTSSAWRPAPWSPDGRMGLPTR